MKIFIYAGRIHHYLKLKPIYDVLTIMGHDAAFITANNAINIDPATEYLTHSGDVYLHMYDYINFDNLQVTLTNSVLMERLQASGNVNWVSPFWSHYSIFELAEVSTAIDGLLEHEKPDAVIGLHENNFWVKVIAYECNRRSIPHYVFQEGLLRQQDQDTMHKQSSACEYSDRLFVWGNSAKSQYVEAGVDEDKVIVSGPVHLDSWFHIKDTEEFRQGMFNKLSLPMDRPVVLFAPPLLEQYKGDIKSDTEQLVSYCKTQNLSLIVKFHPFEPVTTIQNLKEQFGLSVYTDTDPLPVVSISNVVLVQHSSIGIEALALNVPIIEFNLSNEVITQSWAKDGIAPKISTSNGLSVIQQVLDDDVNVNEHPWVQNKILSDGDATRRVIEEIINESN